MATPIAHKGVTAGAKVHGDDGARPADAAELVTQAWDYFHNVQTKTIRYQPLIGPATSRHDVNEQTMEKYRPEMQKYYYDPTKYKTYLEQLGIKYPTVKK